MQIDIKKLKLLMARKSWNFPQVAKAAGISHTALYAAAATGDCRLSTLGKIAAALGVDVLDIVRDDVDVAGREVA